MKKRKKYNDKNASLKNNDTFGIVFESMLKSNKYKKLSIGTKWFYIVCRVQLHSKNSCKYLHKRMKEDSTQYNYDDCFVFPAKQLEIYGIDRSNAHRYFKELEQNGFIKRIEKNNHKHKVIVYRFSDEWKKQSNQEPIYKVDAYN